MNHVVVDLEMNPVSREFREIRRTLKDEVIEIGAVKLDGDFRQIGEFQCYVKPEYGEIKQHITRLTGITQDMVADKETFPAAFREFMNWGGEDETTVYSWSLSDFKQLRQECRWKIQDFDVKWLSGHWVDLQKQFDDRLGLHNSLALKHALGAMDRDFEGTQHTAQADAANTSAILALMQDDAKFRETMKPVLELLQPKEELASSIGDLCPELLELQKTFRE
ncbi:MAG: exonuclease domain-containing protein [Selenomonadaceae bacterium]|nr:exonuclease domain-containing protein [Selenomonadaceae bacterium]